MSLIYSRAALTNDARTLAIAAIILLPLCGGWHGVLLALALPAVVRLLVTISKLPLILDATNRKAKVRLEFGCGLLPRVWVLCTDDELLYCRGLSGFWSGIKYARIMEVTYQGFVHGLSLRYSCPGGPKKVTFSMVRRSLYRRIEQLAASGNKGVERALSAAGGECG